MKITWIFEYLHFWNKLFSGWIDKFYTHSVINILLLLLLLLLLLTWLSDVVFKQIFAYALV